MRGKLLKRVLVLVLSFLMAFSCINIDTSLTYADSVTYTNDITLYFIDILHSELLETVNTSTWLKVNGIDFEGGDNTMYHTDWKTHSINISAFQNQMIKIRFLVYDVGDSAYDTAVVIDDVKLT